MRGHRREHTERCNPHHFSHFIPPQISVRAGYQSASRFSISPANLFLVDFVIPTRAAPG
jgi:hypothetical protein